MKSFTLGYLYQARTRIKLIPKGNLKLSDRIRIELAIENINTAISLIEKFEQK